MSSLSAFRSIGAAARQYSFAARCRFLSSSSSLHNNSGAPDASKSKTVSRTEPIPSPDARQRPTRPNVKEWAERLDDVGSSFRVPRSVQALYLRPLRRAAEYGVPVCDLQLRSYSVRNLEFFADFALRAAYYLHLPASGPVPLPRIVERWTVPRSNFVHKKSQENFERITMRRLIQIKDGHPQSVQAWLAFLRKYAFYGVGMKANVWEHESLDVVANMDSLAPEVEKSLEEQLAQFGQRADAEPGTSISDVINTERFLQSRSPMYDVRKD